MGRQPASPPTGGPRRTSNHDRVDLDDDARRLVWSVIDGPYTHHNGSTQVFPHDGGGARFVWVADLLPNDLADYTAELMERGTTVVKETLEAASVRA